MQRFQFAPFWEVSSWGFLRGQMFRFQLGCDEWHNTSRYVVVPLVGTFVLFDKGMDRSGPEHLFAQVAGQWLGHYDPSCIVCQEILEDN